MEIALERKKLGNVIESSSELLDPSVIKQSEVVDELVNQYNELMNPKKTSSMFDEVFFN